MHAVSAPCPEHGAAYEGHCRWCQHARYDSVMAAVRDGLAVHLHGAEPGATLADFDLVGQITGVLVVDAELVPSGILPDRRRFLVRPDGRVLDLGEPR